MPFDICRQLLPTVTRAAKYKRKKSIRRIDLFKNYLRKVFYVFKFRHDPTVPKFQ